MHNPTTRLETFCDGVFAIAVTLLILEIKVPAIELRPKNLCKNEASRKTAVITRIRCMYAFFVYLMITALASRFPITALSLMAILCMIWIYVGATLKEGEPETS